MPLFKPSETWQKLQELAEKTPAPISWLLPDPYSPTSYITPIGGVTAAVGKALKPRPKINPEAITGKGKRFGSSQLLTPEDFGKTVPTKWKPPQEIIKDPWGKQLGGMNWRPVADALDEMLR
jgi:hypothetical protein